MGKFRTLVLGLFLLTITGAANSGEIQGVVITKIAVWDNQVGVSVEGGAIIASQPACATGQYSWSLPVSSSSSEMMMSLLISAKISQTKVRIMGTGTCDIHSNKETLYFVGITDDT